MAEPVEAGRWRCFFIRLRQAQPTKGFKPTMEKRMLIFSFILNLALITALWFFVKKSGGWNFLLYKMKTNPVAGTYDHKKNQFDQLEITPEDIVFLGNSLTEHGNWSEYFKDKSIKNRGIAGDVTEGILKRLSPILIGKPAKIFLMIGVNDLLFHSPETALAFYEKIIQKIKADSPETKLFLQSLLPVNQQVKSIPIQNSDILILNAGIKKIAQKEGLVYVNLHPEFCDKDGRLKANLTKDGIHLDADGYNLWVEKIAPFVNE